MFRYRPTTTAVLAMACGCLLTMADQASAQRVRVDRKATASKIHPTMQRLLERSNLDVPVKAWVLFRPDKGFETVAAREAAILGTQQTYNRVALERRRLRRTRPGLFDLADVPVPPRYLAGVEATGASIHVVSRWINGASVWTTREQLARITDLPFVERIQPVRRGRKITPVNAPVRRDADASPGAAGTFYGQSEPQIAQINLIALHDQGFTGAGVRVGILDTGFKRSHVAFNEPGHAIDIIAEFDFVDGDPNTSFEPGDPSTQHNHGTWILGTIGAYRPGELVGAAYDAAFILAKTEDVTAEYQGEEDNYVAGLEFIEANGGDMATSSLGYIDWYTQADLDGVTAVTTIAVNIATGNGVHCCTAAGNAGHDSNPSTSNLIAPADALQVLTCGATSNTGAIASFSSDGPTADGRTKPELLARGVDTRTVSSSSDSSYSGLSGTSLSTPLVAGAVACLVQAHPTWTVNQMRTHLFETADYFVTNGTFDPQYVLGYGMVDAAAASAAGCDNGAPCDDDKFCNGADSCFNDLCIIHAGNPCPAFCDEVTDQCVDCQEDADCADGAFCNGDELCVDGACQPAPEPHDCSDGVSCTEDVCNEETDSCEHVADDRLCGDGFPCTSDSCDVQLDCQFIPNDELCDNGMFCDGVETCNATLGCVQGFGVNCDDDIECTIDSCNESTNACDNLPDDAMCDNATFCDGQETCSIFDGCGVGADPCPDQACDESVQACVECLQDSDCVDTVFCNGIEVCLNNECQPGDNPCSGEICVEESQRCVACLEDAHCDDGDPCTGSETCDLKVGECLPGKILDCNQNGRDDACDLEQCDGAAACSDCNKNGALDVCDILVDGAADVNGNGVPDECEPTCDSDDSCNDGNVCTFDTCEQEHCLNVETVYGDLTGSGGATDPDGMVELADILAVLDGFVCGPIGGQCPHNVDIAAKGGDCSPDGVVDLFDIIGVLDAFQGASDCCPMSRSGNHF